MKAIANVDQNWAIGNQGELLVRIPADMKNFRAYTQGKIVVYGRKTLETFPHGKPLPKRVNIILSRNPAYQVENARVVDSAEKLLEVLETEYPEYTGDDVVCIGGQSIYHELLPYCNEALITKVEASFDADAWFDDLDQDEDWECAERGEDQTYEDLVFHFDLYRRKNCD